MARRPPQALRTAFHDFTEFDWDRRKSDLVLELRDFDFGHAARIFAGRVLEWEDAREYGEVRMLALGEVMGEVFKVVYTLRQGRCRIISAWEAEPHEQDLYYELCG